jgi:hypothetical protein
MDETWLRRQCNVMSSRCGRRVHVSESVHPWTLVRYCTVNTAGSFEGIDTGAGQCIPDARCGRRTIRPKALLHPASFLIPTHAVLVGRRRSRISNQYQYGKSRTSLSEVSASLKVTHVSGWPSSRHPRPAAGTGESRMPTILPRCLNFRSKRVYR